ATQPQTNFAPPSRALFDSLRNNTTRFAAAAVADRAHRPAGLALRAERLDRGRRVAGGDHHDVAEPAVEDPGHLGVFAAPVPLQPVEDRRLWPAIAADHGL